MPKFGKRSKENLASCQQSLQEIAYEAIKEIDFTVIEGHRGKEAQTIAFRKGNSKTPWPRSKHNKTPSHAFDFLPFPFDNNWKDKTLIPRLKTIATVLKRIAAEKGIVVSYGGDWESFKDYPHFQLGK